MKTHQELFNDLKQKSFSLKIEAIKQLEAVALSEPEIIVAHYPELFELLRSDKPKLKWGVTILISMTVQLAPETVFEQLGLLAEVADGESVIARDHYVKILAYLSAFSNYKETCIPLLLDEVLKSPLNQLPSYAETAAKAIEKEDAQQLSAIITARLPEISDWPPKTKRLEKVLKTLKIK
ncbi:hypothetical protein DBR32_01245 [Taibaiella sp. KBW10]|uniref:hypothetical protein n=1 Tax=Taibaiella sp. KBW10 TaxID=2153357 RepID=UPI000F5A6E9A|nr:hypothetical protein [Taibaiella sp. KBW10]RQO32263.1 hypothetical protein DBR32_01245 [Taibaiella sp. KBW10]